MKDIKWPRWSDAFRSEWKNAFSRYLESSAGEHKLELLCTYITLFLTSAKTSKPVLEVFSAIDFVVSCRASLFKVYSFEFSMCPDGDSLYVNSKVLSLTGKVLSVRLQKAMVQPGSVESAMACGVYCGTPVIGRGGHLR